MPKPYLVKLKTLRVVILALFLPLLISSCGTSINVSPQERDERLYQKGDFYYPAKPTSAKSCMGALGAQWKETRKVNNQLEELSK